MNSSSSLGGQFWLSLELFFPLEQMKTMLYLLFLEIAQENCIVITQVLTKSFIQTETLWRIENTLRRTFLGLCVYNSLINLNWFITVIFKSYLQYVLGKVLPLVSVLKIFFFFYKCILTFQKHLWLGMWFIKIKAVQIVHVYVYFRRMLLCQVHSENLR